MEIPLEYDTINNITTSVLNFTLSSIFGFLSLLCISKSISDCQFVFQIQKNNK